jgi:uncharacterized protein
MTLEFLTLIGIGFLAQLVDGALGMAFGLISTIALLSLGIPPAQASAAVHTAEVATSGASGLSHLFHRNVDRRLLLTLGVPGVLGGVLGAYVLSNIDGRAIQPFVSAYLLVMGLFILMKAAKLAPTNEDAKVGYAAPLGLVGGFLDAIGGGGWGPMVTSTLIGSGHAPRKVIGSVNVAEFFITVAVATTFFIEWLPLTSSTLRRSSSAACWPLPSPDISCATCSPALSWPPLACWSARSRCSNSPNHSDNPSCVYRKLRRHFKALFDFLAPAPQRVHTCDYLSIMDECAAFPAGAAFSQNLNI